MQNTNILYLKSSLYSSAGRHAPTSAKLTTSTNIATPTQHSAVERGTAFEERSKSLLKTLSISLRRVGGRGDNGIDLLGWWWLPQQAPMHTPITTVSGGKTSSRHRHNSDALTGMQSDKSLTDTNGIRRSRIRVLVQCKAEKRKLAPRYIRELGGVVHRHIMSSRSPAERAKEDENETTVGILVSESPFTPAALKTALTVPIPLLLLYLPPLPVHEKEGNSFDAAFWNSALERSVLAGRADLRWEIDTSNKDLCSAAEKGALSLWHGGMRLDGWMPTSERAL